MLIFYKPLKFIAELFSQKASPKLMQLALWMAMLSVVFEESDNFLKYLYTEQNYISVITVMMAGMLFLYFNPKYRYTATLFFVIGMIIQSWQNWPSQANHSWLALWAIAPSLLFTEWWKEKSYGHYLRLTLGLVMLAAAAQKIIAGNYIDGTFFTFFSHFGSTTEHMFQFMCDDSSLYNSCLPHKALGTFIIVWQVFVGILLILGFRNWWILFTEIGFLLGAGLYADEMNFQVLNIAILCIVFQYGMPRWLFIICLSLLIIDVFQIGFFLDNFILK